MSSVWRTIFVCGSLVVLWQVIVTGFSLPGFILPGPVQVVTALYHHAPSLIYHGSITALEIILGLILGSLMAVVTSLFMAFSQPFARFAFPLILVTQALPVFAIAPLLVIWFGYGLASKLVMTVLIIYFPITSAFYDGLRRTEPFLLELGHMLGTGRLQSLFYLKLPFAMPQLASGLRIGATLAPIGAVVGEWVGASSGLGYIMLHANGRVQTDVTFAALFLLAGFVLLLRFLVGYLTRRIVFWVPETEV